MLGPELSERFHKLCVFVFLSLLDMRPVKTTVRTVLCVHWSGPLSSVSVLASTGYVDIWSGSVGYKVNISSFCC